MKKTVAIIGAVGIIGSPIARGLAAAGCRVLLTDDIRNHPLRYMKLSWLERKIRMEVPQADVEMAVSRREASWEADIIIPAVPYVELDEVASRIKDVVTGKIIISLEVPLNETHNGPAPDPTTSAAEELAQLLPHSKIVKVVSAIFVTRPEEQNVDGVNVDMFVAGDDKQSVAVVMQLVEDAGFHPVVAGTLATGRTLEEVTVGGEEHGIHN
jgi:predicted dinucleotide-binding enzyme